MFTSFNHFFSNNFVHKDRPGNYSDFRGSFRQERIEAEQARKETETAERDKEMIKMRSEKRKEAMKMAARKVVEPESGKYTLEVAAMKAIEAEKKRDRAREEVFQKSRLARADIDVLGLS